MRTAHFVGFVMQRLRLSSNTHLICNSESKQSFEPQHDKTNKMACAPSKNSDQPGHLPRLISLHCPHKESLGP